MGESKHASTPLADEDGSCSDALALLRMERSPLNLPVGGDGVLDLCTDQRQKDVMSKSKVYTEQFGTETGLVKLQDCQDAEFDYR